MKHNTLDIGHYKNKKTFLAIKWNKENKERAKENKERAKENKNKRREKLRIYIKSFLEKHPCSKCDEADTRCLVFHHSDRKGKEKTISEMVKKVRSLENIQKEMDKCIVLCQNCHNRLHISENEEQIKNNRLKKLGDVISSKRRCKIKMKIKRGEKINQYKTSKGCCHCFETDCRCLEFHHIEENKKSFDLSKINQLDVSQKKMEEEIAKCIILCSNCHRKHHENNVKQI